MAAVINGCIGFTYTVFFPVATEAKNVFIGPGILYGVGWTHNGAGGNSTFIEFRDWEEGAIGSVPPSTLTRRLVMNAFGGVGGNAPVLILPYPILFPRGLNITLPTQVGVGDPASVWGFYAPGTPVMATPD